MLKASLLHINYARHHGRYQKYNNEQVMISSGPKFMISLTVETFYEI